MGSAGSARFLALLLCAAAAFSGTQSEKTTRPQDKGKKLFEDLCSSCHELGRVRNQQLTRGEWRQLVAGMLIEGDAATDEEIDLIADYLARTFGTMKP